MELVFPLLRQAAVMLILSGVGFVLFKSGKISLEGSRAIANVLIYVSLPCVIVNSFMVERTQERMIGLGLSAAAAVVLLLISGVVSALCFRKDAIAALTTTFANPGFFGIPLITAVLGEDAVFYIAAMIACLNMGQWTYGVSRLKGGKAKVTAKTVLTAPFMVAIIIGLFLFFTGIRLPQVVTKTIDYAAGLNTPLAMFTIGIYMAQTDLKKLFGRGKLYLVSLVRLVIIPLLSFAVLCLLPASQQEMRLALLIASACPVGSNTAVYAQLYNNDYGYAVQTVVISTLLSVVTLPLLTALAGSLW